MEKLNYCSRGKLLEIYDPIFMQYFYYVNCDNDDEFNRIINKSTKFTWTHNCEKCSKFVGGMTGDFTYDKMIYD